MWRWPRLAPRQQPFNPAAVAFLLDNIGWLLDVPARVSGVSASSSAISPRPGNRTARSDWMNVDHNTQIDSVVATGMSHYQFDTGAGALSRQDLFGLVAGAEHVVSGFDVGGEEVGDLV